MLDKRPSTGYGADLSRNGGSPGKGPSMARQRSKQGYQTALPRKHHPNKPRTYACLGRPALFGEGGLKTWAEVRIARNLVGIGLLELKLGRISAQPALFDRARPNVGIEWCRRRRASSKSEPCGTGSGRALGDRPGNARRTVRWTLRNLQSEAFWPLFRLLPLVALRHALRSRRPCRNFTVEDTDFAADLGGTGGLRGLMVPTSRAPQTRHKMRVRAANQLMARHSH